MPATDKLALLNVLDIGQVLGRLITIGREDSTKPREEVERFREKLGKLLNGVGTELCKICEDVSPSHTCSRRHFADLDSANRASTLPRLASPLSPSPPPSFPSSSASSQTRSTTPPPPSSVSLPLSSPSTRKRRSAPRSTLTPVWTRRSARSSPNSSRLRCKRWSTLSTPSGL